MSLRLLILYFFTMLIFQYVAFVCIHMFIWIHFRKGSWVSHYSIKMQEEQVAAVLYREDIEKYADNFTPFSTYLISTAKVRVPLPYGVPINRFEWVIDKFTVVEEVKDANIQDPPLPPPTRLNTVPFAYLHEQQRNTEFGNHYFTCNTFWQLNLFVSLHSETVYIGLNYKSLAMSTTQT